ncbi:MAG: hypothetical protein HQL07_18710 [Nitrospirae bacterium]|nr:hypothetical protein [Magnetococcales bacterium]
MSVSCELSEPGTENRVFSIYTVTRDGEEVAHCAFTDKAFERLVLAAPDLFVACEAVLKAAYEVEIFVGEVPPYNPLHAALEKVLAACMKARGESCQEDNK